MSNKFLNGMKNNANFTYTENGALTHKTTKSNLLDLFAMGAAYRSRSDEECILLFMKAFEENPVYALKCLFYIRDVRGGQGERRFFRTCMRWLANTDLTAAKRNLEHVPEFGRWDDLLVFIGTPLEADALALIKSQLVLDVQCKTPSLLAKWLPSENTSSAKTRAQAHIVREYLGWTHKQYRKTLAVLRARINVLERLMSEGRWDEIEFDKIPSKAGLKYKNAFARHDIERAKSERNVQTYAEFAKDTTKTVNAKDLYPYEVVDQACKVMGCNYGWWCGYKTAKPMDHTDRLMVNKFWDNLANYFDGAAFNGLAVVDTSASMRRDGNAAAPINVAISLGMYCAEKAKGPFAGNYVSFSREPKLIEVEGIDFCDKVARIWETNLCQNTNIEATFDMLLNTAIANKCSQADLPQNLIIISDQEFDSAQGYYRIHNSSNYSTLMENIEKKWNLYGYQMPNLIFWNVDARQNNIAMEVKEGISFVSGMSPSLFKQILSGKTAFDLMLEVLNQDRYSVIK